MRPRDRSSPRPPSDFRWRPPALRRRPRSPRPSPCPAPPGPCSSCPASAEPASASSSDPSFGDLLHSRHATIEPPHYLANEWIVLGTRRRTTRLRRLTLFQPEVHLHLFPQPLAHVRHQLQGLLLRLLVMKPVAEPQDEHRAVILRHRVEVGGSDGAVQLLEDLGPPRQRHRGRRHLPAWRGGRRAQRGGWGGPSRHAPTLWGGRAHPAHHGRGDPKGGGGWGRTLWHSCRRRRYHNALLDRGCPHLCGGCLTARL